MKRRIAIDYWWKCDALPEIPLELAEALEESAEDRIEDMWRQGKTEGQLFDYVNLDLPEKDTPEDGWYCTGYFTTTTENID